MPQLLNLFDYENAAREKLSEMAFAYYAGGAADEITLRDNRNDFDAIKLRPPVLVDVGERTAATTILGAPSSMPVVIAPTAMAKLAHPDGEVAMAMAAKNAGVVHCLSTLSTTSLEEVARADALRWFQLYVYKDRTITARLVERAAAAGYSAIVLTVDAPVFGKREGSLRAGLQLPPGLRLGNFDEFHDTHGAQVFSYIESQFDSSVGWDDLKWLVGASELPVLVKGVVRGDDTKKAVDCGVAGIVVSNHGGRQLDTGISGIRALPEVVDAAAGHIEVFVDGGVRRGTDIVKALALGARAVLVGRPVLWGLTVAGHLGIGRVLDILGEELDTAMALCGCRSVSDISSDLIAT